MNDQSQVRFDADYFDHHCGPVPYVGDSLVWRTAFAEAGRGLVASFQPTRVLDVGCGMGFLVEQLRDLGVEAYGLDVSSYALSQVRDDIKQHCREGSALGRLGERFDVITCLGVAEHLEETDASQLVDNLCNHTDEVVFSPGIGDHRNPYAAHIQGSEYWRRLFAERDFYPVLRDGPNYFPTEVTHFRRVQRKLKVAVFTREHEDWAVVRLRLLDPLRNLERAGRVELTVVSHRAAAFPIERLMSADVWVVHREFADPECGGSVLEAARLLGKVVVFEVDDLITRLPSDHVMFDYCTRIRGDVLNAAREADFVTTSTDRLAADLADDEPSVATKAHVLPNLISTDQWGASAQVRERRPDEPFVVGWMGSAMHEGDLALVEDAIRYLTRKHGAAIEFHFYGYLPESLADIPGVVLARGPLASYRHHVQTAREAHMHVALAPLVDHEFNRAKSDIKWLEYSIAAIPGIYSRVTPYEQSVEDGRTGLLVDGSPESWVAAIERLMNDDALRRNIAERAHAQVAEERAVERLSSRFDELYRAFVATGPRFTELCRADLDGEQAGARAAALLFCLQAAQQARAGRIAGAAASYEAAVDMDRAVASEVTAVARERAAAGEFAFAETLLSGVVESAPECADAYLALAGMYRDQGDILRAIALLSRAEYRHATHVELALEHIDLLRAQGDAAAVTERLRLLLTGDFEPEQTVALAELCVALGRSSHALALVERTAARFPDVDFSPLLNALAGARDEDPAPAVTARSNAIRVAVYTKEPVTGFRFEQRVGGPLGALQSAGRVEVTVSDGIQRTDIADAADVVVIQGTFALRSAGDGAVEDALARARASGAAVVFELDDLPHERLALAGDRSALAVRDDVVWMMERSDAVTVPTAAMASALCDLASGVKDKIHVLPTGIDLERFRTTDQWSDAMDRPFHIGVFADWARPTEVAELIHAMAPVFANSRRRLKLTTWACRTEIGAALPADPVIGAATPFYREYVSRLMDARIDLAVVPVSNDLYYTTLSDSIFAELGICRVPAIYSAREPFGSSIENGAAGLLLGDRHADWASVIANTIGCPELRRSMADHAWYLATSERLIQPIASRWCELYRSLVAAPRSAAATRSVIETPVGAT